MIAFGEVYNRIDRRIGLFLALPMATLDGPSLTAKIREIGAIDD